MTTQRYSLCHDKSGGSSDLELDPLGAWMRYDDLLPLLDAQANRIINSEIEHLEPERDALLEVLGRVRLWLSDEPITEDSADVDALLKVVTAALARVRP